MPLMQSPSPSLNVACFLGCDLASEVVDCAAAYTVHAICPGWFHPPCVQGPRAISRSHNNDSWKIARPDPGGYRLYQFASRTSASQTQGTLQRHPQAGFLLLPRYIQVLATSSGMTCKQQVSFLLEFHLKGVAFYVSGVLDVYGGDN